MLPRMLQDRLLGHAYTLWPVIRETLRPTAPPPARTLRVLLPDARHGTVALTALHDDRGGDTCLVAIHGLGGEATSPYMTTLADAAHRQGVDLVRMNMRGADGSGQDLYHAGLAGDLGALLAAPELARYGSIVVVGFSLGGHLALRYATGAADPRVRRVVAIGSPLDLARSSRDFDERMATVYKQYVLTHLKRFMVALGRAGRAPVSVARALAVRSIREWDDVIVAPRFGFGTADRYYAEASVGAHLARLTTPAVYVGAHHDPMVLRDSVEASLAGASKRLDVRWIARGGHVGFPADLDLGGAGPKGLAGQIVALVRERSW